MTKFAKNSDTGFASKENAIPVEVIDSTIDIVSDAELLYLTRTTTSLLREILEEIKNLNAQMGEITGDKKPWR